MAVDLPGHGPSPADGGAPHALIERRGRREIEHRHRVAKQAWRHVEQQLVDAALAQQRAMQFVARFDMKLVDRAFAKVEQHRGQIDLACGIRQCDDFNTALASSKSQEHPSRIPSNG